MFTNRETSHFVFLYSALYRIENIMKMKQHRYENTKLSRNNGRGNKQKHERYICECYV